MLEPRKIKAGFVGFGKAGTSKKSLTVRCLEAVDQLEGKGMELFATAPVVDDPRGEEAARAVRELSGKDFDLLILCVAERIPSRAVLDVVEPFKDKPVILWGLSGWKEKVSLISNAEQAGTTALRKPMEDMGCNFKYVVTYCGKKPQLDEIMSFAVAARAASLLRTAKIGMMEDSDIRPCGAMNDDVSLKNKIGPEIERFDLQEINQLMQRLDANEFGKLSSALKKRWNFIKEPKLGTIQNSARLFLALKKKIQGCGYQAFSFSNEDSYKKNLKFATAGAMTLLHEELDMPTLPENDSLASATQLIVRYLTGQVAAHLEFYEFLEDGALLCSPDYVPSEIVDGKVTMMTKPLSGFGEELLNVSKLKTGKLTLCRLSCSRGRYQMHVVTGIAQTPFKWEESGWEPPAPQLSSLEIVFDSPTEDFIRKVMSHRYIISYGDNRTLLQDFCAILGIELI